MTVKIHPKTFDEKHVVISNEEFEKLLEAVAKTGPIEIELFDDVNGENLSKLCEESGAFDFLLDDGEDVYTLADLKVQY